MTGAEPAEDDDAGGGPEGRASRTFREAPIGIGLISLDHRWLQINQALATLFSRPEEAIEGRALAAFDVTPGDPGLMPALMASLADGERRAFRVERRFARPDGSIVDVIVSMSLLRGTDGQPERYLCHLLDVTRARREAAERAVLERRLAERQRLEAVGQLAGGVAHDFNNLLTVILTCVGAALESVVVDTVREDLVQIQASAERAAELTRRLVVLGRREITRAEPLAVGEVIASMSDLLRRSLPESIDLAIECTSDATAESVVMDRSELEQMILNLVLNSRDAMAGRGSLSLLCEDAVIGAAAAKELGGLRPGRFKVLRVIDDGRGMDAETMEHALEPFFTTRAGGTGLGLSTVQSVVATLGGHVGIASEIGYGTSVTIHLPLTPIPSRPRLPPPAPTGDGEPLLIMLVEDEPPVRRQAERVLAARSHEVVAFAAPGPALDALRSGAVVPDLLATDLVMPGMSGQELARLARAHLPGLAVLYLTGYSADEIPLRGNDALLLKPFTGQDLASAVARFTPRERTPAPAG